MARFIRNKELFKAAANSLVGAVNSPVRAFNAVGSEPLFIKKAKGSRIWDVDDNEYIDYLQSWGVHLFGHSEPNIIRAIQRASMDGVSYGLTTELEVEFAGLIKKIFPSIEMVRIVNSGTEAVMTAIRLARGYTGRNKVVKFEGCYHGHSDGLLAKAGSGLATFDIPCCAGVPASVVSETLTLPYNNLELIGATVERYADDIACILVEPVPANMGVVIPAEGFLSGLRELCDRTGAVLIFDEVVTGFRIAPGGAQEKYNVQADLTVLGKILGGGLPVGAIGGKKEIMEYLAPTGPVYQAGTFSGNPLTVKAGITVLNRLLDDTKIYNRIDYLAGLLERGFKDILSKAGIPVKVNRVGSMLTPFFTAGPVYDYTSAKKADCTKYARFFRAMLDAGVLLPPSQFEAVFLSAAHTESDIDYTLTALDKAINDSKLA